MPNQTRSESSESLLSAEAVIEVHKHPSSKKVLLISVSINLVFLLTILIAAVTYLRGGSELNPHLLNASALAPSSLQNHSDKKSASSSWLTCGNTSTAALENGCIFDLMLSTWLRPKCYSQNHSTTALGAANMSFFLDEELTIPFHGASSGDWPQHYIWTQPRFHALHCAYMWERQMMAWVSGGLIDTQSWNLKHTKHCVMTVLERNSPYPYKSARLRRGFSDCGRP